MRAEGDLHASLEENPRIKTDSARLPASSKARKAAMASGARNYGSSVGRTVHTL